jgi:DNA-binding transcriptional LysR family regulator
MRDRRWVVPPVGSTCHELVQRACGAAGFVPTIAAQCYDYPATLALVRAGVGLALVPQLALSGLDMEGLVVRAVTPGLRRYVSVQVSAGRDVAALQELVKALLAAGSAVNRGRRNVRGA